MLLAKAIEYIYLKGRINGRAESLFAYISSSYTSAFEVRFGSMFLS